MYQTEIESIEIFIIYRNDEGREAFFADYWCGIDYLDMNKETPQDFLNALGGLSVRVNKINIILRINLFYVLKDVADFLLNTLCWLHNKEIPFTFEDNNEGLFCGLRAKTTTEHILKIDNYSEKEVSLSYISNDNTSSRTACYFENMVIKKIDWYKATKIALREYFDYAQKILSYDSNDFGHETLSAYYQVWADIDNTNFSEE